MGRLIEVLLCVGALMVLVILPLLLFLSSPYYQSRACADSAVSFEDHRYTFGSGCMVKHNDDWIPLKIVRIDK